MQKIYDSIEEIVGHTPLLRLNKLKKKYQRTRSTSWELKKGNFSNKDSIESLEDKV